MCSTRTLTSLTINFPQMYKLSFYLNSVLHVSLQNPFVFQLFANCCISPSNKRMLIYKPYSFEKVHFPNSIT